jgi:hypothetical protein
MYLLVEAEENGTSGGSSSQCLVLGGLCARHIAELLAAARIEERHAAVAVALA